MPQPHGKRFTPEKRKQVALLAWAMFREAVAKGLSKNAAREDIAGLLDISVPTVRNLVLYGQRLEREQTAVR